jgi:hypothetical protein
MRMMKFSYKGTNKKAFNQQRRGNNNVNLDPKAPLESMQVLA